MTNQIPWCCTGSGYVSECPLCPEYGTSLLDPCPGHPVNDNNQDVVDTARLHAERRHPAYEYATTRGPRKQWDNVDDPPVGEDLEVDPAWERNVDAGRAGQGWDRFDYHEEAYWRRPKKSGITDEAVSGEVTWNLITVPPPPDISIVGQDGSPLVTIHPSGELEYGPNYTPDEAARSFWEALRRLAPARCRVCGRIGTEAP